MRPRPSTESRTDVGKILSPEEVRVIAFEQAVKSSAFQGVETFQTILARAERIEEFIKTGEIS